MIDTTIIAEFIGWIAFAFSIIACLSKNGRSIISYQIPSSLFWTIHMAFIGAIGGALMCLIALFRNILGLCASEKQNLYIYIAFIPLALLSTYIFGEGSSAYIVVLANTIMGAQIVFKNNDRAVRFVNFSSKFLWIIYGVIISSAPIISLSLMTIIALAIATYRHDPYFMELREKRSIKLQSAAAE